MYRRLSLTSFARSENRSTLWRWLNERQFLFLDSQALSHPSPCFFWFPLKKLKKRLQNLKYFRNYSYKAENCPWPETWRLWGSFLKFKNKRDSLHHEFYPLFSAIFSTAMTSMDFLYPGLMNEQMFSTVSDESSRELLRNMKNSKELLKKKILEGFDL